MALIKQIAKTTKSKQLTFNLKELLSLFKYIKLLKKKAPLMKFSNKSWKQNYKSCHQINFLCAIKILEINSKSCNSMINRSKIGILKNIEASKQRVCSKINLAESWTKLYIRSWACSWNWICLKALYLFIPFYKSSRSPSNFLFYTLKKDRRRPYLIN